MDEECRADLSPCRPRDSPPLPLCVRLCVASAVGSVCVRVQRVRYDSVQPPPVSSAGSAALAPEIESTLHVLEQSLAAHPQLLPLLYDIQQRLRVPGADLSHVAPRIQELMQALQAAMEAQTRRTPPPPQHYQTPYAQQPPGIWPQLPTSTA